MALHLRSAVRERNHRVRRGKAMTGQKSAFVAGGTGGIGEGIVKVLLESNYRVFVPIRDNDKSDQLKSFVADIPNGELCLVPGDLIDSKSVQASKAAILSKTQHIDLIVASVGSYHYYYGHSLHKIPRDGWDKLFSENVLTHFNLLHEYLDLLHQQNRGVYITLNGPEANIVHPETGLMSIVASTQKMMARVAAMEAFSSGVKVYSVTSNTPVSTRARGSENSDEWITAEELGHYILALAEQRLPNSGEVQHELQSAAYVRKIIKKHMAHA